MSLKLSRPMTTLSFYFVAVLCFALTACSGEHYTSKDNEEKKVYHVDGQGTKTFTYETDSAMSTIHETEHSVTKRQVTGQEMSGQIRARRTEQLESLSAAPKRQPQDPIYVNLDSPVLDDKVQQAEKSKGMVAEQIRNEFSSDPVIQLVPGRTHTDGRRTVRATPSIADVEVFSKVSMKEVVGVNRKTGKLGKMVAIVFEATITSQVPPASYTVLESGQALQNVEVSKRFAMQVKQIILEKIGPDIPAH